MINHLYKLELYPNAEWNYKNLSANPNITWDIVQSNLHKPWDYYYLSDNPNITWDIFQNNPQIQWDYNWLSTNKFNKDTRLIKKRLMKVYFNKWLTKTREIKKIRANWKVEFSASMDMLKLRQRDLELGLHK